MVASPIPDVPPTKMATRPGGKVLEIWEFEERTSVSETMASSELKRERIRRRGQHLPRLGLVETKQFLGHTIVLWGREVDYE